MTSTINTRSTVPNTTRNTTQHNHRPTGRQIAMIGAATALAAVGITAIMQNNGNETVQAPTALVSSITAAQGPNAHLAGTNTGFATQIREGATASAAVAAPAVNPGPNFNLPATWTEWSVLAAPVAAAGPSFEVPATWIEWSVVAPVAVASPTVNQGPNAEELAAWTERANMSASAAVAGPTIPNVR